MVRGFNLWATVVVCLFLSTSFTCAQTLSPGWAGIADDNEPAGPGPSAYPLQNVTDVFVVGTMAYTVSSENYFAIVDVSSANAPLIVSKLNDGATGATINFPFGVYVVGNYAYVTSNQGHSLEIIDISNPQSPTHVGFIMHGTGGAVLSNPRKVAVSADGNVAYVAEQSGLEIINVSDKANPVHLAHLSVNPVMVGPICLSVSVAASGNYVYVGGHEFFSIVNVTTPSSPTLTGTIMNNPNPGEAKISTVLSFGISANGNYAFVPALNSNAFEVINISNPASPAHAATLFHSPTGASLSQPNSVTVSGNYAFVTNQGSPVLEIIDISTPTSPTHATKLQPSGVINSTTGPFLQGAGTSFAVGNYAYVGGSVGLEVFYLFTPSAPVGKPAESPTPTGFTAKWQAVHNATGHLLDVSTDNFATFVPGYNGLSLSGTASSAAVTGLSAATEYKYRVRASNVNSTSNNSITITALTTPVSPTPILTSVVEDSFTVSWAAVTGAVSYSWGVALDAAFQNPVANAFGTTSGTSATPIQLMPATTYYFLVAAKNSAGSFSPPATLQVLTVPHPPTIQTPSLSDITQTSFKVTWVLSPGTGSVFLDVATDAGFTSFVSGYNNKSLGASNSLVVDQNLQPNTTYFVRVRGANNGGPSANSDAQTFVTLPAAMTATASTLSTINSFRANWTEVPGVSKYWFDVSTTLTFDVKLTSYNNREIAAPATGIVVETGLDPGTTYYYRVRCQNASGLSPSSNSITAVTLPVVPTLNNPSAVTLTTFDASWSASTGTTGYFLDVSTDASFASFVTGFDNKSVGNVTITTVDGLTSSTTYYYRVRASNAGGNTASSASKTVITAPPAPVAVAATSVGQTGMTANWNAVVGVTDYRVDVSSDANFVSNVVVNNVLVSGATTIAVTGLSGGTTYHYRVRATNATAASANSNVISQITIPATPTTSAADPISQTSFTAKWATATGASEYFVDVRDESGAILTGFNNVSVTTGTSLVVSSGIVAGTSYSFIVRAKNSAGTSPSSAAQAVLTVPPTPVASDAEISGTISFTAKWQSAKSATKYNINVSTSSAFSSFLPGYSNFDVGNAQQTTVTVNAPATGATYYYQVSATNASGTSPFSSAITVNTPVVSFPSINLPTGGKVEDYVIISIPDGTTPTTTLSAESFGKTWRITHFDNAAQKSVDVREITSLKVGKGYWVNSNLDEAPTITMTGQTTAGAKTITLGPGWNQIGNPFNFGISWNDVKAKNSSVANIGDLWIYVGGFSKSDDLKGYGGGFVNNKNTASVELTIPTNVVRSGRTASPRHEIEGRDIAGNEWFLSLMLESGGKVSDVGGLGMHPDASNTIDRFDEIALPRFFNLSQINTLHPEFFQPRFMTDVVRTADSFTWTFNISTEESDARFSWDNSAWSDAALYLIDDAAGILLDMSTVDSYSFDPRRSRSIRFAFGRNGQFTTDITSLGQPFPNPSSDRVTFPFISRPGETVGIAVFDLTGRAVGMLNSNGNAGYKEIVWDIGETRLSPGVYLYQFTTSTGIRKTGRLVLK